ncbi:MAG: patatin-like phospholipase family protein [Acidimicrobiales bacterium]|nr:patatin-like phospholipase family protein [Acidimicrobiales bacterium]
MVDEADDSSGDASAALARPISFEARYGAGHERALVLGGGGLWFVAWQVAYLHALTERGIPVAKASRVIGTSAGSLVASIVSAGHLRRIAAEVEFLAKVPRLVGALAGEGELHPSQERALELFGNATDAAPATITAIGHAALAAQAPPPDRSRRSMRAVLGMRRWPAALHTTAVDAYTGERLVVTQASGLSVARAATASSSVPGIFSPQPLHDRRAMDGGVSGTGIHADLAAGAGRALVISLAAHAPDDQAGMTNPAGGQRREIAALEATGTQVLLRGPASVDSDVLMDPAQVAAARADGAAQAAEDAEAIAAAWA